MKPLLLVVVLCSSALGSLPALAAPSVEPMPAEVASMMVQGATTIKFARLPIGDNGAPALFHAWKVPRRSMGATEDYVPSIYCLDFFSPGDAPDKKWHLASSVSYLSYGSEFPNGTTYEVHWLEPKTKQGLVVVETEPNETGAVVRLITLPQGMGKLIGPRQRPYVQEFFTSSNGGGLSSSITFGQSAAGLMTLEEAIYPHAPVPRIYNTYGWKGDRWAKVASHTGE